MPRSSYHQIVQLAMHPAFSQSDVALVCPLCPADGGSLPFTTMRFREYNNHFLGHDPAQEQAYEWLDWRTYRRLAKAKGWPEMTAPKAGKD